jgi:hypothetical protein
MKMDSTLCKSANRSGNFSERLERISEHSRMVRTMHGGILPRWLVLGHVERQKSTI